MALRCVAWTFTHNADIVTVPNSGVCTKIVVRGYEYAYVNTCRRGYAGFGFDEEVLAVALNDTMEVVK